MKKITAIFLIFLLVGCQGSSESDSEATGSVIGVWESGCYLDNPNGAMAKTRYEIVEETYTSQTQLYRSDCDSESFGTIDFAGEYIAVGETVMASGVTAHNVNFLVDGVLSKLDVFYIRNDSLYWGIDNFIQTASEPSSCPEDTYPMAFQDVNDGGGFVNYNCFARPNELNFDIEYRRVED